MKTRLALLILSVSLLTTACGQLPGDYMLTRKPPTPGPLLPRYVTPVTGQYLTFDSNLLPVMAVPATNLSSATGTLAIANGGTGATSASAARTALGLAIGSDVQAYSASTSLLGSSISLTSEVADTLPVANGGTGATSASAARTALGLAIGSDVQAYSASTSLLGSSISLTSEVADTLPVANGGTGATSASAARTALGLAIGSDVQAYSASTSLLGSSISLTSEVSGTLPVANGGTGGTSAATARSGLLPSYASNAGKALVVNAGATDVEFATVGGGGAAIATPAEIWVMATGNNTTGDGSLATPYATAQRAYDEVKFFSGPFCLHFGEGSFGDVDVTHGWRANLSIKGLGAAVSKIGNMTSFQFIDLASDNSVEVASITVNQPSTITLRGVTVAGAVTGTGPAGSPGADGAPGDEMTPGGDGATGGDGQAGPAITLYHSISGSVSSYGGSAGAGGTGGADGGAGAGATGADGASGASGEVKIYNSRVGPVYGGAVTMACTAYASRTAISGFTDAGGNAAINTF